MESRKFLTFTNPATSQTFGQVAMATTEEVRSAHNEMRVAAGVWAQIPIVERVRILRKFQAVMLEAADEISAVINQDCGKTRQDALIEVFMTADMLYHYLKHASRWLRRERIPTGLYFLKRAYIEPRPYGVVAVIAPWNYPFALAMPPILAALLAGNTVLFKPSEVTGATGVMIEKLFARVPELSSFVRVLHGDGTVGAALVASGPDYIFLTGSTQTGRLVSQAAAEQLIPVTCELGGKDAMLVLEDADIAKAARWGAWGACFNTGQTCMAVERVYVVETVYDEFVRQAVDYTQALRVGYTTELESPYYMGPISDPRQIKIISRHMEDALAKGARILTGGTIDGMFVEPTVIVDVDHRMLLMQEETFGPIMPIMKVKNEAEAIRLANDSKFGLSASVWSEDLERAQWVSHQLEAGSVVINDTIAQFAIAMLPFGGIKQSGYGRTHGKQGLMQFTQPYAYVVGRPPFPYDLATIARSPAHYQTVSALMHLAFGVTPRQRIQPVVKFLDKKPTPATTHHKVWGLSAIGLAAGALASAAVINHRYKTRHRGRNA